MTPCQKIKKEILLSFMKNVNDPQREINKKESDIIKSLNSGIIAETVDEQYQMLRDAEIHWDYECDFREGECETNIPSEWSRHYESKSVAMKCSDGSWVGWTYWYGGGKHGDPGSIEWMEDAYNLEVTETEKLVVVREFKKI